MPLNLKIDIKTSKDCKNLIITENTGNYSETNLGGWGEVNLLPTNKIILFSVQCYFNVTVSPSGETKTISPIAVFSSDMEFYSNFSTENNVKGLVMAIPYSQLYIEFYNSIEEIYGSLGLTVQEKDYVLSNFTEWVTIEDHVYIIGTNVYDQSSTPNVVGLDHNLPQLHQFNSTCNIESKVEKYLTKLDFRCEDCDDQNIKDVAFYNVLLQNLKNA